MAEPQYVHIFWIFFCYVAELVLGYCNFEAGFYHNLRSITVEYGDSNYPNFTCSGLGLTVHWFIDGVNTIEMSDEEIQERGININGKFEKNQFPWLGCSEQTSHLQIAPNCLNHGAEIYCSLNHDGSMSYKSDTVTLTIKGVQSLSDLNVVSSNKGLSASWKLCSYAPYINLTLIVSTEKSLYQYAVDNNATSLDMPLLTEPDICNQYNVTLIALPCENSITSTTFLKKEYSKKPIINSVEVTGLGRGNTVLTVRFQFEKYRCTQELADTLQMVLLNSNNIVISTSSPYALDSVTTTNASVYEIKWPVEVNRRRHYYVLLTAQTEYGVVFSDSNKISTFDVKDFSFVQDGSDLCLVCLLSNHTSTNCIVQVVLNDFIHISTVMIHKNENKSCVHLKENGTYALTVFDWEVETNNDKHGPVFIETAIIQLNGSNYSSSANSSNPLDKLSDSSTTQDSTTIIPFAALLGVSILLNVILVSVLCASLLLKRRCKEPKEVVTEKKNVINHPEQAEKLTVINLL